MQVKIKGVSRIDDKHKSAWLVRISREGRIHSKLFSDRPHGGKDHALQAAIQYRDQYERDHPRKPGALRITQSVLKNSSTGILGVHESYEQRGGGKKRPYFCVKWSPEPYRTSSKKFYIDHYDSRQSAMEAAITFRKMREQEIIDACTHEAELARDVNPAELMLKNLKAYQLPIRLRSRKNGTPHNHKASSCR